MLALILRMCDLPPFPVGPRSRDASHSFYRFPVTAIRQAVPVVLLMCATSPTHGAASLEDRVFEEAPAAWERYRELVQRVEGTVQSTTTDIRKDEITFQHEIDFKRKDGSTVSIWRHTAGPFAGQQSVFAANADYAFELQRENETHHDWILRWLDQQNPNAVSPGSEFPARESLEHRICRGIYPLLRGRGLQLPEAVSENRLHIQQAQRIERPGGEFVEIKFKHTPVEEAQYLVERGTLVLDPARFWLVQECTLQGRYLVGQESEIRITIEYEDIPIDGQAVPVPARMEKQERAWNGEASGPPDQEFVTTWNYEIEPLSNTDDSQFRLAAFGLSEPTVGPSRTGLWLVVLNVGLLLIVLAFLLRRWARKKRDEQSPVTE